MRPKIARLINQNHDDAVVPSSVPVMMVTDPKLHVCDVCSVSPCPCPSSHIQAKGKEKEVKKKDPILS